jgi:3-hydroxyacyl-CoA dehydrogenase / enoyl-CoA hydratase / 3-hydroxybutyryl-CoA epimerase
VLRRVARTGGQTFAALVGALTVLLDGRRRSAADALALGLLDELAPADALSHALGIARRVALAEATPSRDEASPRARPRKSSAAAEGTIPLWSPLAQSRTMAFPNVERDPDAKRLLAHHEKIPRSAAARAILDVVKRGLTAGLEEGLAAEAEEFGKLVASDDGRAGIDRFLARQSLPLPLRRDRSS